MTDVERLTCHSATVNGLKFHYQQAGAGPDVVLIHGVTGDLSIWFLCKAMQTLGATHRVTAYDLRGHGYSDAPPTGYTSADHAADLFALDGRARDRASATLVGHSFGGVIAAARGGARPRAGRGDRPLRPVLPRAPAPGRRQPLGPLAELPRGGRRTRASSSRTSTGTTSASSSTRSSTSTASGCSSSARPVGLPALNRLLRLGRTTCGDDSKARRPG